MSSAHSNVGTDGSVHAGSDGWGEGYVECNNASGASRTRLILERTDTPRSSSCISSAPPALSSIEMLLRFYGA
ncbi:hypothetical protein PG991_009300 [Apiospora marii]|uniref:Uncharacterized protein n=1 Tax=Apiospora marii TaxID=335849 RepID=A0ABR1RK84_9PEZI